MASEGVVPPMPEEEATPSNSGVSKHKRKKRKDRSAAEVSKVSEAPKGTPPVELVDRLNHEQSDSGRSSSNNGNPSNSERTKLDEHEREQRRDSNKSIPDFEQGDQVSAVSGVLGWLYDITGTLLAIIDSHTSTIKVRGVEFEVQVKAAGLVLSRSSVTDNRNSCIPACMQQNAVEMSALRIALAAKEQEIKHLTQQIEDGRGDFESTGLQLTRVLGLKGQQTKRLQKLEQTVTVRYQRVKSKMLVQLPPGLFTMVSSLGPHPVLWCQVLPIMQDKKAVDSVEEEVPRDIANLGVSRTPFPPSALIFSKDAVRSRSDVKRKQLDASTTIHLNNLPYVSTEEEVKTWFEGCGRIERVLLPVCSALELDGLEQHGRVVRVNLANAIMDNEEATLDDVAPQTRKKQKEPTPQPSQVKKQKNPRKSRKAPKQPNPGR